MGLFRKKPDPISERAKSLNDQIAALEAQIKKLADEKPSGATAPAESRPGSHPASAQPRLRSTTLPHAHPAAVPPASAPPKIRGQEPIFEDMEQRQLKSEPRGNGVPEPIKELGMRKHNLTSAWQRLKNHFRGPATSNPKLVSYLAAGSIQGLRPLRYEKRVARNRFMLFFILLFLALWGLLAMFLKK